MAASISAWTPDQAGVPRRTLAGIGVAVVLLHLLLLHHLSAKVIHFYRHYLPVIGLETKIKNTSRWIRVNRNPIVCNCFVNTNVSGERNSINPKSASNLWCVNSA